MAYSESLAERVRSVLADGRSGRPRGAIGTSRGGGGSGASGKSRGKSASVSIAPGIVEKKMFGSACFLLNGNLLVGVWKDSLIVRLDPAEWSVALQEPNVAEFDATGRSMTGWVVVEPDGLDRDDELKRWIDRAVAFIRTLPPK